MRSPDPAVTATEPTAAGLPPAAPLARCLAELADAWQGGRSRSTAARADGTASTPEALTALAGDLSLQSAYRSGYACDLEASDFPCIVLMKSGLGRVLTRRLDRNRFAALANGEAYEIGAAALAAEEAGTIFTPRPTSPLAASEEIAGPEGEEDHRAPVDRPRKEGRARSLLGSLLGQMITRQPAVVVRLLAAAVVGNLLLIALPLFTMAVYDRVIPHGAKETLWALSIGVVIALSVDICVRYVRLKLADALAVSAGSWLQARLFRHLTEVELARAPRSAGAFATQLREADAMAQALPPVLTGVLVDLPFLAVVFSLLAVFGGPIVFAPMAGIVALYLVNAVTDLMGRKAASEAARVGRLQASLAVDTLSDLEAVKAATCEPELIERWERLSDQAIEAGHRGRLWAGMGAYAGATLGQAIIVGVVIIAVYQITDGQMTVGALSASTLLIGRAVGPISQLIGVWHKARMTAESLKGLGRFLASPSERPAPGTVTQPVPSEGALTLSHVSFAYEGAATPRLTDATITIRPGEKVALIGRSGSGKSTLLKLLVRIHEPTTGTVSFAQTNLKQYAARDLRRVIGYMRQDPSLFDDTLLNNIALGAGTFDEERFRKAAAIAGVADFAQRLPEGFGLNVGPRGERLSGGERQSVALARLLYRDPPVLVLDEPTSSMDTIMEARVVRDLKPLIEGRTLVIATHRAPLLNLVDRLVWIEDGRIRADGPKAEVLERLSKAA